MSDMTLLVLNGPGLANVKNFANERFGVTSLDQVRHACEQLCTELGIALDFRQSDDQHQILQWISEEADCYGALIINPLGCVDDSPVDYARYCSDLEILATLDLPVTEIHMTNVFRYDPGKFKTLTGPVGKTAFICGLGLDSYRVAIRGAAKFFRRSTAA